MYIDIILFSFSLLNNIFSVAEINVNDQHDYDWWEGRDLWKTAIKANGVATFFLYPVHVITMTTRDRN